MKAEGNAGVYVGGTEGIPLPRFGEERNLPRLPAKPKPRGLDWSQHRAPEPATTHASDPVRHKCRNCARRPDVDDLVDGLCPICQTAAEERYGEPHRLPDAPPRTLTQELAHLEATDATVAAAAHRLDDVIDRITQPLDHVMPPTSEPPVNDQDPSGILTPPDPVEPSQGNVGPLLTALELEAMETTAHLAGLLGRIVANGPTRAPDMNELVVPLHVIQHAIMAQAAARAYPGQFRLLGDTITTAPDAPAPAPAPAPAATRPRPERPPRRRAPVHRAGVMDLNEAEVITRYQAGESSGELATAYHCTPKRIRAILDRHHIERRDDRATRSGSRPREFDQDTVRAVVDLYTEGNLSRTQVAARLGLPYKTVVTIMARHAVPARRGQSGNADGAIGLKAYMVDHGLISRDIKAWAFREGLIDHIARGLPSAKLVQAYADAHGIGGATP